MIILRRIHHPYTQNHYAAAGVDIERLLATYLAQGAVVYGPEFDRTTLTDINHDLFPKDEFALPYTGIAGTSQIIGSR